MSSFHDAFDEIATESHFLSESTHPVNNDEETYAPQFSDFADPDSVSHTEFESNRVFDESDGPILPPHSEMQEEGFALREWRRQNATLLEQKENREKEILSQIIEEANDYKVAFHEKRKVTCENNQTSNREKEKLFLGNLEKFHKEADKNYWKAIAELIPNEVPAIVKKRGKKDQDNKKPSVIVLQGPKPGKPTDLARMRQILVKLKHTTPTHLNLTSQTADDSETETAPPKAAAVAAMPEAVVAA